METKKTVWNKGLRVTSAAVLIGGMVLSSDAIANLSPEKVQAATATPAPQAAGDVIALVNGDFENPRITTNEGYGLFDASLVPGWETSASDNLIEVQNKDSYNYVAPSGSQWGELNGSEVSALYQDIPTTPGVKVRWQVYHRGALGVDTAVVEFGAPGGTMVQQAEMADGNTEWGLYTGSYTIPAGQTTTRFQFRSLGASGGNAYNGNMLDDIQFATPSVLDVAGSFSASSTKLKQNVDYNVHVSNVGGMPSANNTVTVKIPKELVYTVGSLTSANTTISNEQYDAATGTLTFTVDRLVKDASTDITIPLTGAEGTPAATPETSMTYNDENFEDETYTADGTDASVEVTSNDAPVLTGEDTTLLNPGNTFDPMSGMKATDTEDGDLTSQIQVLTNNVDTTKPGTYEVTYEVTDSDGNKATFTRAVVMTEAPTLTGEATTTLNPNSDFDPMATMQAADAEDGDITDQIKVVSNPVDTSKPGSYTVTYEVVDAGGNKATFTRTIIVTAAPVIAGQDTITLQPGATFDPMVGMEATDEEDGDVAANITVVQNDVDTSKSGSYKVIYEVTDKDGNKTTFTSTVIVEGAPVFSGAADVKVQPDATFDPMQDIKATDTEDGDLTASIKVTKNDVNTSKAGAYEVTYEVTDSKGNKTTFTRTVTVPNVPTFNIDDMIKVNPDGTYDPMEGIEVTDEEDGDLSDQVRIISNNVDVNTPGHYEVVYEVTDSDGNKTRFTRTVIITAPPVISGDDEITIAQGSVFDPMIGMSATDTEDGNLTGDIKVISNPVQASVPGEYLVTYQVTDTDGNVSTFTRKVIVKGSIVKMTAQPITPAALTVSAPTPTKTTAKVEKKSKAHLPRTGDTAEKGILLGALLSIASLFLLRRKK
ncbi:immunoglobulin-like domain-containing protein [Listeria rustica]|uniref:DUF5011 domain-containing protein n=1 Tax=Listeria rustica TaxID=2713503 RepID=A0A7W1YFF9_9LIST|nr:immunoglobulin-like domain-containing protein [Listeria rustica]MBA3925592.1 DUF5011 domain-containing protein [Listeria rustica]